MNGDCVDSTLAPTGDCLFGDGIIKINSYSNNIPPSDMNCQNFLDYAYTTLNQNAFYYCDQAFFYSICCSTCKSNNHFKKIIIPLISLIIKFFEEYNLITCRDNQVNCPTLAANNQCNLQFNNGDFVKDRCKKSCSICICKKYLF